MIFAWTSSLLTCKSAALQEGRLCRRNRHPHRSENDTDEDFAPQAETGGAPLALDLGKQRPPFEPRLGEEARPERQAEAHAQPERRNEIVALGSARQLFPPARHVERQPRAQIEEAERPFVGGKGAGFEDGGGDGGVDG